jgi:hypothetical protein
MVIVGLGAHKRSHTAVAVDDAGRRLGQRTIGTSSEDHLALLGWAEQFPGGVPASFLKRSVPTANQGAAGLRTQPLLL